MADSRIRLLLFAMIPFISGIVLYHASGDIYAGTSNTYIYVLMCMIPFLIAITYWIRDYFPKESSTITLPSMQRILIVMLISIVVYYLYGHALNAEQQATTAYIVGWILEISMIVVGLAIVGNIVLKRMIQAGGVTAIIARTIFFIPCLLNIVIEYLIQDYQSTSRVIWILVVMEAVLITGYLLLKTYIKQTFNGLVLQEGPVYLDKGSTTVLATNETLSQINSQNNQIYSISFWLNLDNTDSGTGACTLFYYSNPTQTFNKPLMTFDYSDQTICIYAFGDRNDMSALPYKLHVPFQRWNLFVFRYEGTRMDLFVNGELRQTFRTVSPNTFSDTDQIGIGDNHFAFHGAISNVLYYPYVLSMRDIANMYTLRQMGF